VKKLRVQSMSSHPVDHPGGTLYPAEIAEIEAPATDIDALLEAGIVVEVPQTASRTEKDGKEKA
jgi:hypothetical protein